MPPHYGRLYSLNAPDALLNAKYQEVINLFNIEIPHVSEAKLYATRNTLRQKELKWMPHITVASMSPLICHFTRGNQQDPISSQPRIDNTYRLSQASYK